VIGVAAREGRSILPEKHGNDLKCLSLHLTSVRLQLFR
jgi:hypothetical protein